MASEEFTPWRPNYQEGLQLIICVIQRGKGDKVAKAAMEAGAGGVTVFFGRGMGQRERLGLLGLAIVPEKEVLMIVAKGEETRRIFDAVVKSAKLDTPGMGIAYVIPIHEVAGLIPGEYAEKIVNTRKTERERVS
jgi:nitrogen regulatory protein P-II 1